MLHRVLLHHRQLHTRVHNGLRVSRTFVEVLDGGGGGGRTPALRVSVIGEEWTSVQSQADRVVGTSDQRRLERRELDVAASTGSTCVTQRQVLRSPLRPECPRDTRRRRKQEAKERNVRSHKDREVDREEGTP